MGKIEESIMDNYKRALSLGNLIQARKCVELARNLKLMVEQDAFVDYDFTADTGSLIIGNIFEPFSYKYNPESGTVLIRNMLVSLTSRENRLFFLLSGNETFENNIKIVKREEIKNFVWPEFAVTDNAVRILVRRLRQKIEPNPLLPQILLNYNKKGYVFVAKKSS